MWTENIRHIERLFTNISRWISVSFGRVATSVLCVPRYGTRCQKLPEHAIEYIKYLESGLLVVVLVRSELCVAAGTVTCLDFRSLRLFRDSTVLTIRSTTVFLLISCMYIVAVLAFFCRPYLAYFQSCLSGFSDILSQLHTVQLSYPFPASCRQSVMLLMW